MRALTNTPQGEALRQRVFREKLELAGDKMRIEEDEAGTAHFTFDDKGIGRRCGDCQLCCKLVPVGALRKAAGEKCRFARVGKGCTIYAKRPFDCRSWSCRWMSDAMTAGMPRPDRAHYVIDLEYDYVTLTNTEAGTEHRIPVMQVWCDPNFRTAWDTKPLRDFMQKMAERWKCATIIRWNSLDAITVFPPAINPTGEWHVMTGGKVEPRNALERQVISDALRFGQRGNVEVA